MVLPTTMEVVSTPTSTSEAKHGLATAQTAALLLAGGVARAGTTMAMRRKATSVCGVDPLY